MAILVQTVDIALDLGVVVDSHVTMMTHLSAVCRAAYCQLRKLHPLICSLSFDAAKLLVQAFISTCLDYCNSLLYGIEVKPFFIGELQLRVISTGSDGSLASTVM